MSIKNFFAGQDTFFIVSVFSLIILGLFILTSASLGLSAEKFNQPYYYILHQIIFGLIPGIFLLIFTSQFNYRRWRNLSLPIMIFAIGLMVLVFLPHIGFYHGGAKRWLSLGSISFQPSEFLKFAFVLYLASWLEVRFRQITSFKFGFLPFLLMSVFVASFLIFQPDMGTLLVLLFTVFSLFFLSGGKLKQIAICVFLGFLVLSMLVFLEPYRLSRIMVFFDHSYDATGAGYQINQALVAIGSGGIFGKGFGLSFHKFGFLPEVLGDSVFAVFAEELGFLGVICLLALFLFIFLRGIYIVNKAPDDFGYLLGAGILLAIIYQVLINIAAISGLMPLTGIPLSFISYGGSALAIMMGEVGILLNISKHAT